MKMNFRWTQRGSVWGNRDLSRLFLGWVFLFILGSVFGAGSKKTWAASSSGEGEYQFGWLDPDKKIYVLQNRKYLKAGRVSLGLMGGFGVSSPYRNTYVVDPRIGYYFSENWGVEGFYTSMLNSENTTAVALQQAAPTTLPSIRENRSMIGGVIHYVPWYAKINVYNSILYFDWYFGLGAASIQSFVDARTRAADPSQFQSQSLLGLILSTGHQYHLSQSFLLRIDVTAILYQASVNGLSGDSAWYSNYNFGFGLGLRL